MYRLNGVCLLTGGASGIGRGVAVALATWGCQSLVLADIDYKGLLETKDRIQEAKSDSRVEVLQVDISEAKAVEHMVRFCVETFGRLDYAVNVAGIVPQRTPIAKVDLDIHDRVVRVNEHGTWLCHRAQIRQIITQSPLPGHGTTRGSIVTISSLAGLNASSGMSTYCASKHAIVGFAKADAIDYGPQGVRINVICPGMVDTDLFRATSPPEAPALLANITPVRRLGKPEDIAALVAFLCSEHASFMHGTVIPCDGGLSLSRSII